jgi:hypothetical protein
MATIYIWDGLTDFQAPHRRLFDFNRHRWTDDYLSLAGQPLLSLGIEWHGSRRHGGWEAEYHLAYWGRKTEKAWLYQGKTCEVCGYVEQRDGAYHEHEVGEECVFFKLRTDLAALRKELRPHLRGIQLDQMGSELVIDAPPIDFDKIRAYYDKGAKNLRFKERSILERFVAYAWGLDAVALIGVVGSVQAQGPAEEPLPSRVRGVVESLKPE